MKRVAKVAILGLKTPYFYTEFHCFTLISTKEQPDNIVVFQPLAKFGCQIFIT